MRSAEDVSAEKFAVLRPLSTRMAANIRCSDSVSDKFMLQRTSDMRYNWIDVRLDAIDLDELRELVIDGWRMCVPKSVSDTVP